jgi:hypothetical protein
MKRLVYCFLGLLCFWPSTLPAQSFPESQEGLVAPDVTISQTADELIQADSQAFVHLKKGFDEIYKKFKRFHTPEKKPHHTLKIVPPPLIDKDFVIRPKHPERYKMIIINPDKMWKSGEK